MQERQLPRHLMIKIISLTDLDTKRTLGVSPGRLTIPHDFQADLGSILLGFESAGLFPNHTYLWSPYEDHISVVPMYTIVRLTKKASSYERNPSYIVRTVDKEVVVWENCRPKDIKMR